MKKLSFVLLALLLVCQAFPQSKIVPEDCIISKLQIQYDNTTCNGYLLVDASNHFYCYPEPIDSFITPQSSIILGSVKSVYNTDSSFFWCSVDNGPLVKHVQLHEGAPRSKTTPEMSRVIGVQHNAGRSNDLW